MAQLLSKLELPSRNLDPRARIYILEIAKEKYEKERDQALHRMANEKKYTSRHSAANAQWRDAMDRLDTVTFELRIAHSELIRPA